MKNPYLAAAKPPAENPYLAAGVHATPVDTAPIAIPIGVKMVNANTAPIILPEDAARVTIAPKDVVIPTIQPALAARGVSPDFSRAVKPATLTDDLARVERTPELAARMQQQMPPLVQEMGEGLADAGTVVDLGLNRAGDVLRGGIADIAAKTAGTPEFGGNMRAAAGAPLLGVTNGRVVAAEAKPLPIDEAMSLAAQHDEERGRFPWAAITGEVSQGLVKTAPKLAAIPAARAALGGGKIAETLATANLFGRDEQGQLNAKSAVAMGLLPFVSPAVKELTATAIGGAIAKGATVLENPAAQKVLEELGHQAGLNAYMVAIDTPELAKLRAENPAEFRKRLANITATNLGFGLLGAHEWRGRVPSATERFIERNAEIFTQDTIRRQSSRQAARELDTNTDQPLSSRAADVAAILGSLPEGFTPKPIEVKPSVTKNPYLAEKPAAQAGPAKPTAADPFADIPAAPKPAGGDMADEIAAQQAVTEQRVKTVAAEKLQSLQQAVDELKAELEQNQIAPQKPSESQTSTVETPQDDTGAALTPAAPAQPAGVSPQITPKPAENALPATPAKPRIENWKRPLEHRGAGTDNYTLLDAVRENGGGLGGPDFEAAVKRLRAGEKPAKIAAEYGGEYDALADVLETIGQEVRDPKQNTTPYNTTARFRQLRAAYQEAGFGGDSKGIDRVHTSLLGSGREGRQPAGGLPESPSELIARAWDEAQRRTSGAADTTPEAQQRRFHEAAVQPENYDGLTAIDTRALKKGDAFYVRGKGISADKLVVTGEGHYPGTIRVRAAEGESGGLLGTHDLAPGDRIYVTSGKGDAERLAEISERDYGLKRDRTPTSAEQRTRAAEDAKLLGEIVGRSPEGSRLRGVRSVGAGRAANGADGVAGGKPQPGGTGNVREAAGKLPAGVKAKLERALGARIIEVENSTPGDRTFNGYYDPRTKTILLNRDAEVPLISAAMHEALHHLEISDQAGYDALIQKLLPLMQRTEEYRDMLGRVGYGDLSDANVRRELVADFLGDSMMRPDFLNDLAQREPALFQKLGRELLKWFDRILAALKGETPRGYEVDKYFSDVQAARNHVADALAKFARKQQFPDEVMPRNDAEVENEPFSKTADDFSLAQPESVEEQRLRMEKEAKDAEQRAAEQAEADKVASAKRNMLEQAAKPLGGDLGSAGQGGLFEEAGQQEIFKPQAKPAAKPPTEPAAAKPGELAEEMKPVEEAFDNLFNTIESETGEDGNVRLFSLPGRHAVADLDARINRLLEKRAGGGLSVDEERRLRSLESQRGQQDLLTETDGEGAAQRVEHLRRMADEMDRRANLEVDRANNSTHRYQEYFENAAVYQRRAEELRKQARQLAWAQDLPQDNETPELATASAGAHDGQMSFFSLPGRNDLPPVEELIAAKQEAEAEFRKQHALMVDRAALAAAGVEKSAARQARNLAVAKLNTIRRQLRDHPQVIEESILAQQSAQKELESILAPHQIDVDYESLPNPARLEKVLTPDELKRVQELYRQAGDVATMIGMAKPGILDAVMKDMQARGLIPKPKDLTLNAGRTLADLTKALDSAPSDSPKLTLLERLALGRKTAERWADAKDATTAAWARLQAGWHAFKKQWQAPPVDDAPRNVMKQWFAWDQQTGLDIHRYREALKLKVPNIIRRRAMSVWLDAGGDAAMLRDQLAAVPDEYKPVWQAALELTPGEKQIAMQIKQELARKLDDALTLGLVERGRADYGVPQRWKPGNTPIVDYDPTAEPRGSAGNPRAKLDTRKPFFGLERVVPSYFDGIMAKGVPENLDIAHLVSVYDAAFHKNVSSRVTIGKLRDAKMPDGMPVTALSGTVQVKRTEGGKTFFVDSEGGKHPTTADGRPYRSLDHFALRAWELKQKDTAGNPIFVKGDMLVHPDFYEFLKNELGTSGLKEGKVGKVLNPIRQSNAFLKSSKLAFAGFHLMTIGEHMASHLVNPFTNGFKIDLKDPDQALLVYHGLELGFGDARMAYEEGLSSHGGLFAKIPGLGDFSGNFTEWMFKKYIPTIAMKIGVMELKDYRKRYAKELAAGEITEGQLAEAVATQMNAGSGYPNYRIMGRNKTLADLSSLALLAPKFLEARARVVAQAFKPYGAAQRKLLIVQAMTLYMGARIINQLLNDDPHWESENAFSVVYKGRAYGIRTIVGDMWHLFKDPASFASGRLSPFTKTAIETMTERDMRTGARKQPMIDTSSDTFNRAQILVKDMASWLSPVGSEGFMPGAAEREQTKIGSVLGAFGVGSRKWTAQTEVYQLASKFNRNSADPATKRYQKKHDEAAREESAYRKLDNLLAAGEVGDAKDEYSALVKDGHKPKDIQERYNATKRPFTGKKDREKAFLETLNAEQRKRYDEAIAEREEKRDRFNAMVKELVAP